MKSLFSRGQSSRFPNRSRRSGSAKRQKRAEFGFQEQLETRRALAVEAFTVNGPSLLREVDPDDPTDFDIIFRENSLRGDRSWVTVVSDGGDDIYVQQISPADPGQDAYVPSLLYANNASFLDFGEVKDINGYTDLYATNASLVRNKEELQGLAQDSDGYPFNDPGTPEQAFADRSFETTFVLPTDDVDWGQFGALTIPVTGQITNGVGGVWSFTNRPGEDGFRLTSTDFTPVGVPTGPNPRSALIVEGRGAAGNFDSGLYDALFIVTWDSNSLATGGMSVVTPPVLESISYDFDSGFDTDFINAGPIEASSPADPSYQLPLPNGVPANLPVYELAPGSLKGVIDITQHDVRYEFTTITQFPVDDPLNVDGLDANVVRDANGNPVLNAAGQPLRTSTLVFRRLTDPALVLPWRQAGLFATNDVQDDFDGNDYRFMTGILTYRQDVNGDGDLYYKPTVELTFRAVNLTPAPGADDQNPTVEPVTDTLGRIIDIQEVGRVTVDATYAIFNQPEQFVGGNFTFYDGHDFSRNLTVDMLAPGATISIESPILYNPPGGVDEDGNPTDVAQPGDSPVGHFIDLRASNTYLEAQMWSGTSFNLRDSRAGQGKAEQLFVNAANAAKTYDIRVKDDPLTDSVRRSKIVVSTTGSLAGLLPSAPGILPENAESLFILSNTGDVFVEGTIAADYQSYLMQSPAEFNPDDPTDKFGTANRAPYYLTTQGRISEAITGKLRGISLAVTLGNDTPTFYDDPLNGGSSAFNIVTLTTEVDSIRVQASDRKGNPIQTPFPYNLWLQEEDKLRVDAVAASSLPLAIYANDDLTWNATVLSASDVSAESLEGHLDLNAPLNTTFGTISLAAQRLQVRNSVRVLDTFNDVASLYNSDIILTARNGDLVLTGPISGVNTVELVQEGKGAISGDSRVVAERVLVRAEGSVTIKTETAKLAGSAASITVDETDDLYVDNFSVTDGFISLVANGYDQLGLELDEFGLPTVDEDGDPTNAVTAVPALRGVLPDARAIVASAPNGSIHLSVTSADSLVLGDTTRIAARTAQSMVAAGSVFIESYGGSIDVYDAPFAASSATRVRAATTDNLDGTYVRRTPGTFADTLTANNLRALVVDGVTLQVRDFVLLKDQGNPLENGVYQVVNPGSAVSRWVLRRLPSLDQTFEIPEYFRATVSEGSLNSGKSYVLESYANELGATPRAVTTVLNNFDAIEVRAVSTSELRAEYAFDAVSDSWSLTGSLDSSLPLFDGVQLQLNDIVLVRMGSRNLANEPTKASNGVYVVSNVGSDLSPWVLTQVTGLDGRAIETGIFKASEGTLSAKRTGSAFKVYYDSLGWADMNIVEAGTGDGPANFTKIGSRDVNDRVRFITSTNLGTNNATGSLGKMITLYNENSYVNVPDADLDPDGEPIPQSQAFAFWERLGGNIRLTQELPRLTRTISIDSSQSVGTAVPVVVDGSRIRQNRDWSVVQDGESVDGFEFVTNVGDSVDSANANESRLAGLYVGGFTRGAAVKITNSDDVLIRDVKLGAVLGGGPAASNRAMVRLSNKVGIDVGVSLDAADGEQAGGFNTVLNSTIYSSSQAGIRLKDRGQVRVVGSKVGQTGLENATGVEVVGGNMLFGLMPANVSFRRNPAKVESSTSFSLPGSAQALGSIYAGLGVSSPFIEPTGGFAAASIQSISDPDPVTKRVTIVIENGTLLLGEGQSLQVAFGSFTQLEAGSYSIPMPVGVLPENIFLGQTISGTGIPGGATIVKADDTTIWMSSPATVTSEPGTNVAVVLGTPQRNTIAQNSRGAVVRGGESRFIATDISNSVFDGLLVSPSTSKADSTIVTIGGASGRTGIGGRATDKDLAFAGNAIYGNGSAGIRIATAVPPSNVVIRGNRLGVTRDGALNVNKAGNILSGRQDFYGPVTGTYVQEESSVLQFFTLDPATRTVSMTSPVPLALARSSQVGLRFTGLGGGSVDAVASVTSVLPFDVDTASQQFTVTLSQAEWDQLGPSGQASLESVYTPLSLSSRTVLISSAVPHGLSQGDSVLLRFGGLAESMFTVTKVNSVGQFTVTLSPTQYQALPQVDTTKAPGVASRIQYRVTLQEDHFLQTGHLLWLEFGSRNGQSGSVQDARKVTRIAGSQNQFLVDGIVGIPAGGNVFVNRYGRQAGSPVNAGSPPVQYAFQLRRTNQIDYEGNLHGLATTAIGSSTGGVVSTLPVVVNPVVNPVQSVRPPVRR